MIVLLMRDLSSQALHMDRTGMVKESQKIRGMQGELPKRIYARGTERFDLMKHYHKDFSDTVIKLD